MFSGFLVECDRIGVRVRLGFSDEYFEGFFSLHILHGGFNLDVVNGFWMECDHAFISKFFLNSY